MNTELILHGVLGLLLLVIPVSVLYLFDQKLLRTVGVAIARMVGQLLAICLICWLVMRYDKFWLTLLWLVGISVFSTFVVLNRAGLSAKRFLLPVGISQFVGCLLVGLYVIELALPSAHGLSARWLVPVMSLLSGHSLVAQLRGLNVYHTALKADEQQYEFLRGNGVTHLKAVVPFIRRAVQAVLAPAAANLRVMGLFTMPLLLCGLLVAGIPPMEALVSTVVLTTGCVAASVVTLLLSIWLSDRRLFDPFGKLTLMFMLLAVMSCRGQQEASSQQEADGENQKSETFYDASAETATKKDAEPKKVTLFEQPAALRDRPEQILHRKGYIVSYNSKTKTPNWVAWHLTKAHTTGSYKRDQEAFTEDTDIKGPRATDNDYYNSRYDRGHMCPAGDNKWDQTAMTESFLFTNICPQNHGLNKYEWNDLEVMCRRWAREYGAVDIVCGPLFYGKGEQKTIGRNKVWVPDAFFKVILCRKGEPKAIGFVYRNEGKKQTLEEAVRAVDEVERLTGIDFFPALDDAIEDKIEAQAKLGDW